MKRRAAGMVFLVLGACSERPTPIAGDATNGRLLLQQFGCITCHRVSGVAGRQQEIGPPLDGAALRVYLAGHLPNNPEQLVAFIRDPQALVPGTTMPTVGLTESQARDIAAYLWSLSP
jgi:cytochrome c